MNHFLVSVLQKKVSRFKNNLLFQGYMCKKTLVPLVFYCLKNIFTQVSETKKKHEQWWWRFQLRWGNVFMSSSSPKEMEQGNKMEKLEGPRCRAQKTLEDNSRGNKYQASLFSMPNFENLLKVNQKSEFTRGWWTLQPKKATKNKNFCLSTKSGIKITLGGMKRSPSPAQ